MRTAEQAQPRKSALPSWLSGQTIALLSGMIALGAFCQNGFSSMRQDLNGLRTEVNGEIQGLRAELKGDIAELRTELKGDIAELRADLRRLEDRTRAVEVAVVGINVRLDNLAVRLDNLERVVADLPSQVAGPTSSAEERLAGERPAHMGEPRADGSPIQGIAGNE